MRKKLIDNSPEWNAPDNANTMFWLEWNRVEYRAHYKAKLLFRDPKELYGPVVQACWDKPWQPSMAEPPKMIEDTRDYLAAVTGEI